MYSMNSSVPSGRIFTILVIFTLCSCAVREKNKIQLDGDVIFGGLFPMHEKGQGRNVKCGTIKKEKGIQRLEAMLYAVDRINSDDSLLPGIKIGVHILDTCSSDTYALEQCMDFIKAQLNTIDMNDYVCEDGRNPDYTPIKPVAGVIGAASSTVSIMVANILRLFKIPQISYASTSIDLSDKSRFEFFSRVVQPDSFQAQAMVDIAKAFGWNYVNTLADEGNYGVKGIGAFIETATRNGVCTAQRLTITRDATDSFIDGLVEKLLNEELAKGVVMFVNEDNTRRVLQSVLRKNRSTELSFLASDSWGAKIHPVLGQESAAEGAVTILPKRRIIPEFDTYFKRLHVDSNSRNPWFKEYWNAVFNCTSKRKCNGMEHIGMPGAAYEQEGLVQFVIDSVYALAHALHNLYSDRCPYDFNGCPSLRNVTGSDILMYIRNVSFIGIGGDTVRFDEKGDGLGTYDIYQYQLTDNGHDYVLVGEWTDSLFLNKTLLRWKSESNLPPRSVCSEACPTGYAKLEKGETCCWACIKCADNQYLKDLYTCADCDEMFKPTENKSSCQPLPVFHLKWNSMWVLLPIVFSSFGIICTILVFAVFIRYNTTPVIMASGRELCYVLLVGIFLAYVTSLSMLIRPTVVLCAARRIGLGVSLCLIYAAMLTKTNRIYRIFNSGIKAMVKRPSYTSPRSQVVICMGIVSVQVIGGLTWLAFEKPDTVYVLQHNDVLVLKCGAGQIAIIVSLTYNIFLIIICTVYGIKTRKIPQNFNEAKYIAFTMYSTCIVWLAFILTYFGASSDFKIEVTSLCMCVSISATVALVCLFAPKMYIVLLQPHKNVRQGATTSIKGSNNNQSVPSRMHSERTESFSAYPFQNGGTLYNTPQPQTTQTTFNDVFSDSFDELSCDEDAALKMEEENPTEADI